MSSETKYEHPGTWLPGDQIIDRDGGLCERGGDGKWRWYLHRDGRAYVEQRTDAGWTDEMVDSELALPGTRIVHLVPRPEPSPASSEDARRMLAARQEGAPVLPDTSGWVKREPGDVIEAGTPYVSYGALDHEWEVREEAADDRFTILTPPPAEPVPEWTKIPEGRENARVLEVNGVVGTYFRLEDARYVYAVIPSDGDIAVLSLIAVDGVVPVRVLGDDQVAVERGLIERAARFFDDTAFTGESALSVIRDLAALLDGEA